MPSTPAVTPSRSLSEYIVRFGRASLTLMLPVECGGCATPDTRFCGACATQLERESYPPTERRRPVDAPFPVFAAAPYAGLTRASILNFKEQQRTDLRRPLGGRLEFALNAALAETALAETALAETGRARVRGQASQPGHPSPLVCVPIPSPPASLGKRGYRHVELLAATLRPAPAMHRWLKVHRSRLDQVGLTQVERQHNAAASIRVASRYEHRLRGCQVLLLDDIVTTGASLRAAGEALNQAGAHVVAAVVVAHTERRFGVAQADPEHPQNLYGVPQG